MSNELILCIESSSEKCSLALGEGTKCIALKESLDISKHNGNASMFAGEIIASLPKGRNLDAIAVVDGPGSYTGLRIAASLAKGLAFCLEIPLIAISSLNILAYAMSLKLKREKLSGAIVPMMDARRMEIYASKYFYDSNKNKLMLRSLPEAFAMNKTDDFNEFQRMVGDELFFYAGNGSSKVRNILSDKYKDKTIWIDSIDLSAEYMPAIAHGLYLKREFADVAYWTPNYIKNYHAVVSTNKVIGTKPNTL